MKFFSIGHGNRSIGEFISLLKKYEIDLLVDVRSVPYSRFNHFVKEFLESSLDRSQICYCYMGDLLGGRPTDPSCYTEGVVDYSLIRQKEFFKKGLHLLKEKGCFFEQVAIMCSEKDPRGCHRALLISEEIRDVHHIDGRGEILLHKEISPQFNVLDLFG